MQWSADDGECRTGNVAMGVLDSCNVPSGVKRSRILFCWWLGCAAMDEGLMAMGYTQVGKKTADSDRLVVPFEPQAVIIMDGRR